MQRNVARTGGIDWHVLATRLSGAPSLFAAVMTQRSADPEGIFNAVVCARTRAARISRGLSQAEVARALGINRSAYARHETHQPLPLHLLQDFVELTGADYDALFASVEMDGRAEIPRSA